MQLFYLYHGSLAISGAAIGVDGLLSASADGASVPVALMVLGGGGLVVVSTYKAFTSEPADFELPARNVFAVALGALLILLGVAIQILA
ncbi:hypothetical protein [Halorussus pelagicus]|uniref:hypothetical protein n=1 Tax=Halorussus pelagicus TaxID=2505977 RepID=UPI000FFC6151|nr:hypothetical protein [Halorussus pelagicus]